MATRIWNRLREHWTVGPLTVYGFNAMHVALNLRTPWGYLCFHPPLIRTYGRTWPWYLYHSRDATPWDGWGIGPGYHGERRP